MGLTVRLAEPTVADIMMLIRSFLFAASCLMAVSLGGCGALAMLTLETAPVPPEKSAFIGVWTGGPITLEILSDGTLSHTEDKGSYDSKMTVPIAAWTDDTITAGAGPFERVFSVDASPHQESEQWTMTIDGQVLTRQ